LLIILMLPWQRDVRECQRTVCKGTCSLTSASALPIQELRAELLKFSPRVGAGYNTSNLIPASRKRRRKGNPVVSGETVMYGYESSATLTTDRLHYKLQTSPLAREGAPRRRAKQVVIPGKIRCALLYHDSSKHCTCPLNKFI
jgi:hypothetical protein